MSGFLLASVTAIQESAVVQLFVCSAGLLIIGLAAKVWSHSMRLSFLDAMPLSNIEFDHPHLPRTDALIVTAICGVCLLLVSIDTVGVSLMPSKYSWMYLGTFFGVMLSLGMLSEMKYHEAHDLAFAFIAGTALAFAALVFTHTVLFSTVMHTLTLLALLSASTSLAWNKLCIDWTKRVKLSMALITVCWLAAFFML